MKMISLADYLVESGFDLAAATAYLKNILDNPGKNEQLIKQLYIESHKELKEKFFNYCESDLGFTRNQTSIVWKVFVEHESYDLMQILIDTKGIIDPTAITNSDGRTSIFSIIPTSIQVNDVNVSLDISHALINDLMGITINAKKGIGVGRGELFLSLFVKTCKINPGKNGDLLMTTGQGEVSIEAKGEQAKLQGQDKVVQPKEFYKNWRAYYRKYYADYKIPDINLRNKREIDKLFKAIKNAGFEMNEEIINLTKYLLMGDGESDHRYFENDYGVVNDYIEFLHRHITEITNADTWLKTIQLCAAKVYQRVSKFTYLLLLNLKQDFMVFNVETPSFEELWPAVKKYWFATAGIDENDDHFVTPKLTLKEQ